MVFTCYCVSSPQNHAITMSEKNLLFTRNLFRGTCSKIRFCDNVLFGKVTAIYVRVGSMIRHVSDVNCVCLWFLFPLRPSVFVVFCTFLR